MKFKTPIHKTLLVFTFLFTLVSCGSGEPDVAQPGPAAIEFFEAIYNKQDLDQALKLATPQYGRILSHYHTAQRVQSVLFNRRYDKDKVEIEEDKGLRGQSLLSENAKRATVSLMLDGTYEGNRHRDLKHVVMVKQQGRWLVDKLKADVYR
ncbi:hypothetical protein [Catenovulum sediminis]|uniref:hypothetical protein n=1 Tax=Catenovulum sediminis TaxID=1740262 RepID=UPI00117EE003|nr:hypothetical protein [Catenovulum sediminis]